MINPLRIFTRDDSTRLWEHLNEIRDKLNEALTVINAPSAIDLGQAGLVAGPLPGVITGTEPPEGTILRAQVFTRGGSITSSSKFVVHYPEPFANGLVTALVAAAWDNRRCEIYETGLSSLIVNVRNSANSLLTSGSVTVSGLVVGW